MLFALQYYMYNLIWVTWRHFSFQHLRKLLIMMIHFQMLELPPHQHTRLYELQSLEISRCQNFYQFSSSIELDNINSWNHAKNFSFSRHYYRGRAPTCQQPLFYTPQLHSCNHNIFRHSILLAISSVFEK